MSWGEELWDQFGAVLKHTSDETDELNSVIGKFVKERGEVEKEYARKLRKLVERFTPKEKKKEEEPTVAKGLRLLLKEVGFQAGQHEILSEALSTTIYKQVKEKVKNLQKMTEKYKSEAKKLGEELDKSSRALDRSKQKYRTAYITWESANNSYAEAERNGNVTPIEVSKLRSVAGSKQHISDDCKGQYAQQLLKTNQFQEQYYFSHLPAVLNNLQNLDHTRISYIKEVLSNCLKEERSIVPIVSKCYDSMDTAISGIDPSVNSVMVVDKLKTGNVPPPDFTFEEMGGMGRDGNTISRKSSRNVESNGGNVNFYQKKRELEKRVEDVEKEVEKGQKEMKALQLMVQTYSQNPKFGDAKQFQGELDAATHKVQMFESDLHSLKTELQEVECKLESLKNRSPFPGSTPVSMRKDDISPSGSRTSSVKSGSMSQGYGTISNYSGSDKDSIEGNVIPPGGPTENVDNDANVWGEDEWDDDEILPPPPPPPPPPMPGMQPQAVTCVALYPFDGDTESNIPMTEGEEFIVTEPDQGGWIKVRRIDDRFHQDFGEGYVPTAFVRIL